MKRPQALAVVAILLAVTALLLWRGGSESPLEPPAARDRAPSASAGADGVLDARLGAPLADEGARDVAAEADASRRALATDPGIEARLDEPPIGAPLCRVTGVVVDERGQPLAGVALGLTGRAWPLSSGARPLPHHDGGDGALGFEARSDASGRFEFAVPPPTSAPQRLSVGRDPFRAALVLHFGFGGAGSRPGLGAGSVDLGTLQLAAAGAIRGRVVDGRGQPIADALVRTGPNVAAGDEVAAATASDGTFALGHVPVGARVVTATAPGHRRGELGSVVVEAGREIAGLELVLERAPTISGYVRDEDGAPIADAKIVAWPHAGGQMAFTFSDADGRFELALHQAGTHSLEALREGFARWGDGLRTGTPVEPDGELLAIVMRALTPLRVAAVDAHTGAALASFGVRVLAGAGSGADAPAALQRTPPIPEEHPDGIATVFAEAAVDLLVVSADGYAPAAVDAGVADAATAQVVRLVPVGRVTGRVLRAGTALADVEVSLTRGTLESAVVGVPPELSTDAGTSTWFRPGRGAVLRTRTDGEGRFAFESFAAETALFVADVGPGAVLERLVLGLSADERRDLGDLDAQAPGRIDGSVDVGSAGDPAGLVVLLDERSGGREALVDARGAFVFEDVAPGAHLVRLLGRSGVLGEAPGQLVDVAAGRTATVVIDARDRALSALELTVVASGTDVGGRDVTLLSSTGTVNTSAGPLDAGGTCRAFVRTEVPIHAAVWFEHGLLTLGDQTVVARAGTLVEARVEFGVGRIALTLPRGLDLPASHLVTLRIADGAAPLRSQEVMVPVVDGVPIGATVATAADGATRLTIADVLAGACQVVATITDLSDPAAAPLHTSTHDVRIEVGGVAELVLP